VRYWWVNQNQTFRHEIAGGYLWSPKRIRNGGRWPFYEFMREVGPGDLIFSFCDTRIPALGIATSHCYECPKPEEFGATGMYWEQIGWKVDVRYQLLTVRIRPVEHIDRLRPHLPEKYSPLSQEGRGSQAVYLTELPWPLADALLRIIGPEGLEARDVAAAYAPIAGQADHAGQSVAQWEEHLRDSISNDDNLSTTEREQLILARRGQGRFRRNVSEIERHWRVTRVEQPEHLIASHMKPWRDCESHDERLDGENGLFLTPSIDHLFDRGFISFRSDGRLLIAPSADRSSLLRMGIPTDGDFNVGNFTQGQRRYLDYHRDSVFLESVYRSDSRE
jgi:hypothetical protein